jgi:putative transcriptional regulator
MHGTWQLYVTYIECLTMSKRKRPPALDIAAIRARTGLSQSDFATSFGFTINQICDWEQSRSRPLGGVRAYLMLIEHDFRAVLTMLRKSGGRRASASLRSASSAR